MESGPGAGWGMSGEGGIDSTPRFLAWPDLAGQCGGALALESETLEVKHKLIAH